MTDTTKTEKQSTALVSVSAFDKQYPESKYNQLLPSKTMVESVQKFSKLTVETVRINPNPDAQEVYSLGKTKIQVKGKDVWVDKLSPTKTSLDKLWFAMGLDSVPEKSGRTDDRSDRDYFEYLVVARVTKPDGTKMEVSATKSIDVRTYVEEMFENMTQQHEAGNLGEWKGTGQKRKLHPFTDAEANKHIDRKCRNREIEMRKHGLQLAETGAKNRLVRQITNLKPWYTEEELSKAFVVARIDRNVEEIAANPQTRAEAIKSGSHAVNMAYPSGGADNPIPTGGKIQNADFEDVRATTDAGDQSETAEPDAADLRQEFEDQCREMDVTNRFRQMETLIEKRQIKSEGTDNLLSIEYANWEKRGDGDQVKNLMWAYDQPKPDGLPH